MPSDNPELFRELAGVRQYANEPKRRWFITPGMDLIVWVDELDRPFKFQLCYETQAAEYALTWEALRGFNHAMVDDGERTNRTPILCGDAPFEKSYLLELFKASNAGLPADIGGLVLEALTLYPASPVAAGVRPAPLPLALDAHPGAKRRSGLWAVLLIATVISVIVWVSS